MRKECCGSNGFLPQRKPEAPWECHLSVSRECSVGEMARFFPTSDVDVWCLDWHTVFHAGCFACPPGWWWVVSVSICSHETVSFQLKNHVTLFRFRTVPPVRGGQIRRFSAVCLQCRELLADALRNHSHCFPKNQCFPAISSLQSAIGRYSGWQISIRLNENYRHSLMPPEIDSFKTGRLCGWSGESKTILREAASLQQFWHIGHRKLISRAWQECMETLLFPLHLRHKVQQQALEQCFSCPVKLQGSLTRLYRDAFKLMMVVSWWTVQDWKLKQHRNSPLRWFSESSALYSSGKVKS